MAIHHLAYQISKTLISRPAVTIAAGKLAILLAREMALLRTGEIDGRQFRVRTGGHVGSSAGIVGGAAAGIAFGSLMPGVGNVIGAFAGGLFGAMGGEHIGRVTADLLETHIAPTAPKPDDE